MDKRSPQSLEDFYSYLLVLARIHLKSDLKARVSPSDLVQQTLLEAQRTQSSFRGRTFAQQAAWLRKILVRAAAKVGRDYRRQKRDIHRERSIEAALERSSVRLHDFLKAQAPSPSSRAIQNERLLLVAQALAELPEAQQETILLHFIEGLSMVEIGNNLGRTSTACAGLLHRALKRLRELLANGDGD